MAVTSLLNDQGETLDPIVRPDGAVALKAAGHLIAVAGQSDPSAPHLVQDYPGQYTLTPTGLALQQGTGTLAAATYYYRVSAITSAGETLACAEVGLAIGATTGVILTWNAMAGATGYRIYGRSTGAELFIAAVSGTTLTYTDSGALTPSGALPTANTARIGTAIELEKPATAPSTRIASSATSVTLLVANTARKGVAIYNESTQVLYVRLAAAAASATAYWLAMAASSYAEVPFSYTGEIRGIWASANGAAMITESV